MDFFLLLLLIALGSLSCSRASSTPFDNIPARRIFPSAEPKLCVAFISCCGLDLSHLSRAYAQAVKYLDSSIDITTGLPLQYELVWYENGSEQDRVSTFASEAQFDRKILKSKNQGLSAAMNAIYHEGLCHSPYILVLEDDWLAWPLSGSGHTHISTAIEMLEKDQKISGVRLKKDFFDKLIPLSGRQEILIQGKTHSFHYQCMAQDKAVWGAFTNAGAVYPRARIAKIGRFHGGKGGEFPDSHTEANFAYRVGMSGLCSVLPRFDDLCPREGVLPPLSEPCCNLYYHTGASKSSKHSSKIDEEPFWLYYDTPLWKHPQVQQMYEQRSRRDEL